MEYSRRDRNVPQLLNDARTFKCPERGVLSNVTWDDDTVVCRGRDEGAAISFVVYTRLARDGEVDVSTNSICAALGGQERVCGASYAGFGGAIETRME
jgi:hypothetical protein